MRSVTKARATIALLKTRIGAALHEQMKREFEAALAEVEQDALRRASCAAVARAFGPDGAAGKANAIAHAIGQLRTRGGRAR